MEELLTTKIVFKFLNSKIPKSDCQLRHACAFVCLSFGPHETNRLPLGEFCEACYLIKS